MGGIVDAVGGLFGASGRPAGPTVEFNPWDVTSPLGTVTAQDGRISTALSPELQNIFSGLLGQFGQQTPFVGLSDQLSGLPAEFQATRQQLEQAGFGQLGYAADPMAAYGFISEAMSPELERQRASQESRLLSQGILGSTTGGIQTQALRQAQESALMQQSLAERQAAAQQGLGLLGAAGQFGQLGMGAIGAQAGLQEADFARQMGLLSGALGLGAATQPLLGASGEFGQASMAALQSQQAAAQAAQDRQSSFFGSLIGAGAEAGAFKGLGTAISSVLPFSDKRLKKNLVKIGVTDKGVNVYSWKWNEKAEDIGADSHPTVGVIAQEVQQIIPEAVIQHENGYLMVDYSKVA